jgi:hypothetical protein
VKVWCSSGACALTIVCLFETLKNTWGIIKEIWIPGLGSWLIAFKVPVIMAEFGFAGSRYLAHACAICFCDTD